MGGISLTLKEACRVCRDNGWQINEKSMVQGIVDGRYPFGKVVGEGYTGRRTYEIFRGDLLRFIREKSGADFDSPTGRDGILCPH